MDDPDEIYGIVMSQGVTFFTAIKYSVEYRTYNFTEKKSILSGELYVLKTRNLGFLTSRCFTDKVEDKVLEKWIGMSQTLQLWFRIFRLCATVNENSIATSKNLNEKK